MSEATSYTPEERRLGQRRMIAEGVFVRTMESATGGVILASFALLLGASDFEIGLLAAIPFLAQLAQIPTIALLARYADRRRVTVVASVLARLVYLLVALLPLFALPLKPIHALVPLLVVQATIANVSGAAWQVWVRGLVDRSELGRYFGRRMTALAIVGLVSTLVAGQFVTWWRTTNPERELLAFSILFAAGALLGLVSSVILARTPALPATKLDTRGLAAAVRRPLAERNYRRVLVFLGAWGFAANFALPFVAVVMLKTLGYKVGLVVLLAAVSQVANVIGLKTWGPITDRFGNKPVLAICGFAFIGTLTAWAFVPDSPTTGVLVAATLLHVVLGFVNAGLDLGANGVVMKLAPEDDLPAYLSSASLVRAVTSGVAPLAAGALAYAFAGRTFIVDFVWSEPARASSLFALSVSHYDFLFLVSAALGLYALHRLLGFEEAGETRKREVVRAMRRDAAQITSVAGMRQFAHVASYLSESALKIARQNRLRDRE